MADMGTDFNGLDPAGTLTGAEVVAVQRGTGAGSTLKTTIAAIMALAGDKARTGDLLLTASNPGAGWLSAGSIYSQASYPDLFALVGAVPDYLPGSLYNAISIPTGSIRQVNRYARISATKLIGVGPNRTVWMSYDNGLTWSSKSLTSVYTTFTYVAMTSLGLFIGSNNGSLLRSTDEGETFTEFPSIQGASVCSISESLGRLFVCMLSGTAYYSDNAGSASPTWTPITTVGSSISIVPFGNGMLVSFLFSTTTCYRSTNNGASWTSVIMGLNGPAQSGADLIQVEGPVLLFANSAGVVRSENYGANFTAVSTIGSHDQIRRIGDRMLALSYGTTLGQHNHLYSDDFGKTWVLSDSVGHGSRTVYLEDAFGASLYRPNGGTDLQRTAPIYNYDETTQFRAPRIDGLSGLKGYVKA